MVLKGPRSTLLLGTPSLVRGEIKIWLYLPSFPSPLPCHPFLFSSLSLPSLFTTCSFRPPLPPSAFSLLPSFFGCHLLLLLSPQWIRYATAVKFICLLV